MSKTQETLALQYDRLIEYLGKCGIICSGINIRRSTLAEAESIHAASLTKREFKPTAYARYIYPAAQQFIKDNPGSAPFFYGTTMEETGVTVAIDEKKGTWLAHGTVDLSDLGFTKCPSPF